MGSKMSWRQALMTGCSVLCVSAIAGPAPAQETGAGKIEEIFVTAQKRTENLQKVPIAVSAVTSSSLQKAGALRTDQLQAIVPGLQVGHEINSATTFLRGIGPNANGTGQESSVAMYLDDLYVLAGNASVFSLNGIENVQVLKGPQGTLFGRNATGGVIQVRTKDPQFEPTADLHLGFANYDTKSADLYVSGGLVPDKLAINFSAYGNIQTAGWGRNVFTGNRAFTSEEWGGRAKALFTPTDSTRVLVSYYHFYTESDVGLSFNQVPEFVAAGGVGLAGATFVGWNNTQTYIDDKAVNMKDALSIRIDQETPIAKIVSISGWQEFRGYARFNQEGSPAGIVITDLKQRGRQWTEELQILNPDDASYASWLKWIVGGFYLQDITGYNHAELRGLAFTGLPVQTTPWDVYLDLTNQIKTTSWSGFAQGTVAVLPKTNITLGARYTRDRRAFGGGVSASPGITGVPGLFAPVVFTADNSLGSFTTFDMMTYRAAIDHQLTDDVLVYFSFNRGVKSGQYDGFGTSFSGPILAPAVNPEVLLAYEVGAKTELFDNRLRLNVAAFHYKASNLQFTQIVAGGTRLLNAAGAEINGGEIDFVVKPFEQLTLSGGVSILYGHYTSFPGAPSYFLPTNSVNPAPPNTFINATGNPTVRTPRFTGTLAADYVVPTEMGDFDFNVTYTHTTEFEWFPDKSLQQPSTDLIGTSLLWTAPSGRFDARLWANNLADEKYYAFGSESAGLGKQFSPAPPRTYGITLGLHI